MTYKDYTDRFNSHWERMNKQQRTTLLKQVERENLMPQLECCNGDIVKYVAWLAVQVYHGEDVSWLSFADYVRIISMP